MDEGEGDGQRTLTTGATSQNDASAKHEKSKRQHRLSEITGRKKRRGEIHSLRGREEKKIAP